jgi:uncharacterized membrane protein
MKSNLRLVGAIICGIALAIFFYAAIQDFIHDYYLLNNQSTFKLPSWIPLIGGMLNGIGFMLILKHNRSKMKDQSNSIPPLP